MYTDKTGKQITKNDVVMIRNGGASIYTYCTEEAGQLQLKDRAGGYWTRQLYHQPERLKIIGCIKTAKFAQMFNLIR